MRRVVLVAGLVGLLVGLAGPWLGRFGLGPLAAGSSLHWLALAADRSLRAHRFVVLALVVGLGLLVPPFRR